MLSLSYLVHSSDWVTEKQKELAAQRYAAGQYVHISWYFIRLKNKLF